MALWRRLDVRHMCRSPLAHARNAPGRGSGAPPCMSPWLALPPAARVPSYLLAPRVRRPCGGKRDATLARPCQTWGSSIRHSRRCGAERSPRCTLTPHESSTGMNRAKNSCSCSGRGSPPPKCWWPMTHVVLHHQPWRRGQVIEAIMSPAMSSRSLAASILAADGW
jgi:hypothetical protein